MSTVNYRPDIQGLRAIAVLFVMLFHFNPHWMPGGFIGVDVFLVISGYLITSMLLEQKAQPGYRLWGTLRHFYVSRFKRIVPAYFAMLVLVSLLAAVLFLPQDLAVYKNGLKQAALFNSNHYFAGFGDYFAPANHEQPLLHTWSLAVEIQFYLLAPFLVLLLPVKALKWVLAILLIGLTALAEYRLRILGVEQETYYSLYARLPAFFAGALVAIWIRSGVGGGERTWFVSLGVASLLACAVAQPLLGPFPGVFALWPVAGAVLILLNPARGLPGQLLGSHPMVWLGKLSYSLYLWHWPVLALLRYYTGSQVLDVPFSLIFIFLTLFFSAMSFYLVEIPLRAQRARYKQLLGYGLLAGAVLATGPAMASINKGLSLAPLSIESQRYADPATICHGKIMGDCLKGDLNSDREVLVLGDSHAAMLNLFFDQLGKDFGFKARIITASSCVTIPRFDYQRISESAQKPCLEQIEHAQHHLSNAKVVFLASFWSWHLESNEFQQALDAFLSKQSNAGVRIYLMEQEPLLSKNPQRVLRFNALSLPRKNEIDTVYKQANITLQNLASHHPNVSSLNFEASGFFDEAPFAEGVLIYFDEHHLNEVGAKRYATIVRGFLSNVFQH
jgi:peptidoglycan/LPS O-acetylase OafA/YrhL